MITVCKVCNEVDTHISNGDCDGCRECNAIEQGFLFLTEFEFNANLYVDDDQNLYDDDNNFIDTVDNWLDNNPKFIREV